jgi:hypothetical protein
MSKKERKPFLSQKAIAQGEASAAWRPWYSPATLGAWYPRIGDDIMPIFNVPQIEPNGKKTLGLSLLSATTVFSAFSAFNPSIFTLRTFSTRPEARERAMPGLWLGLGASLVGSVAIGLSFGEWTPAVVGSLTGALLFGISMWAIHAAPPTSIPPMERQEEVTPVLENLQG